MALLVNRGPYVAGNLKTATPPTVSAETLKF